MGTHEGVLRTPGGEVGATGRRVDFCWAALYRAAGDELVSEHLFFDQLELVSQLGRAPTRRPSLARRPPKGSREAEKLMFARL